MSRTAVETVFRIERARLVAGLARITRDISLAEDLAQEALVAALSDWPRNGVPRNPGAWLMAAAKRRAIDGFRRNKLLARKHAEIADTLTETFEPHAEALGDDLLALIFTACHPVLTPEASAALTLRLIGGLTTAEIARAFLTPEPTIAARVTRAKKAIAKAGARFEIPEGMALLPRLASVLEVLYLIFNEGYAATTGADLIRPALCTEARRLARILTTLLPEEPEVHGLSALMDLQASRLKARVKDGKSIPLPQQNRTEWDHLLIQRGLASLAVAQTLAKADQPYRLQAALAACHARARTTEATGWREITSLYDRLLVVMPSPVVALNRAVAHSMAYGPEAGLALLDELTPLETLRDYAPLPAARGDFLLRAGRLKEARTAFLSAAALTRNEAERAFLLARAENCVR